MHELERIDPERSPTAKAIAWFGIAVGLILAAVMAMAVVSDRRARMDSAEHEATALAQGARRVLWLELRNLERALQGIAADAAQWQAQPGGPAEGLEASMRGVAARQPEFESIVIVDAAGRALGSGRSEPRLPAWMRERAPADRSMTFGPLQQFRSDWVLPMVVPMQDGRYVLARLRAAELQRLLAGVAPPEQVEIRVVDRQRRIVADNRGGAHVGLTARPWRSGTDPGKHVVWKQGDDGAPRLVVDSALPGYPLQVSVGMSRAVVLQRWWTWVSIAVLLQLLYWLGLARVTPGARTCAYALAPRGTHHGDRARPAPGAGPRAHRHLDGRARPRRGVVAAARTPVRPGPRHQARADLGVLRTHPCRGPRSRHGPVRPGVVHRRAVRDRLSDDRSAGPGTLALGTRRMRARYGRGRSAHARHGDRCVRPHAGGAAVARCPTPLPAAVRAKPVALLGL